jgi:hypothetical protein
MNAGMYLIHLSINDKGYTRKLLLE